MATWKRSYLFVGSPFGVASDHAESADRLLSLLAPLEAPLDSVPPGNDFRLRQVGRGFELWRGSDRIRTAGSWPPLVNWMLVEINRAALANYDGLACHAGVVAAGGAAIAFPARSRGGKSTLTSACVLAGFDYVSDEALCVGFDDGVVAPYPRPIELSGWSREHLRIRAPAGAGPRDDAFVSVADIGGRVASGSLELAHLVMPEIAAPGSPADLERLPRSAVVTNLLGNSFNHYKRPDRSFRIATSIAASCGAWRLAYSSAAEAAGLLRAKLAV